jgi:hypothetical protein
LFFGEVQKSTGIVDRKFFPTPQIAKLLDTLEKVLIVLIGWGLGIAGA